VERRVIRQRQTAAAALGVALVGLVVVLLVGGTDSGARSRASAHTKETRPRTTAGAPSSTHPRRSTTTTRPKPSPPEVDRPLQLVHTITGEISPKSVVATGTGLVFAQNMMYRHTMTVYDDADGSLVKTIPDGVELAHFGYPGHAGVSQGAPVEGAVSPDGKYFYVTNYSMYGANFGPEGSDECSGPSGLSPSFVYRVDLRSLAIDAVTQVGMVPKYIAVTPDNRYILVTNWCSFDLSVIDRKTFKEVRRIPLGTDPRGIAISPDSRTAYVAVMGSSDVARLDLGSFAVGWYRGVGLSPRHVVLSPGGQYLYVTLNGANEVAKLDTGSGAVVARVTTGSRPRSMAISPDGTALYVVNYDSNTVTKLRASDMSIVQTVDVGSNPIGITFDPATHRVWVACYSGEILVYDA
jgi:YVTN family beta-propeller protein